MPSPSDHPEDQPNIVFKHETSTISTTTYLTTPLVDTEPTDSLNTNHATPLGGSKAKEQDGAASERPSISPVTADLADLHDEPETEVPVAPVPTKPIDLND